MFAEVLTVLVLFVTIPGSQQQEVQCLLAARPVGSAESHVFWQEPDGTMRPLVEAPFRLYVDYCARRLGVQSPTNQPSFYNK
jgi:hypothetical protein